MYSKFAEIKKTIRDMSDRNHYFEYKYKSNVFKVYYDSNCQMVTIELRSSNLVCILWENFVKMNKSDFDKRVEIAT